jgi:hypothetical protein
VPPHMLAERQSLHEAMEGGQLEGGRPHCARRGVGCPPI